MTRATLIGFGEAGQAFACGDDWPAFDINPAKTRNVTLAEAVDGAKIILSVVTADQALAAARQAAKLIEAGALFCDMNSVAPGTKEEAALLIEAAGGRYVDVAVMSPVYPTQRETPLLLAGPHADAALAGLVEIGFTNARVVGDQVGRASTIKMLRSVMYKGLEALTAECLIAAERAGVIDDVLDALEPDWSSRANYRLNRMMVHGLRRAAEMEESAKTLAALGVEPLMTLGTVERQRAIGMKAINPPSTLSEMLKALEK
jgi:3-hydroxyisobutyrate dehydrogenase-like beta-hydroxyacid dehydrogenase